MDHGSFWIAKLRRLFRTRNMPIICWHWIHDLVVCGWPLTKNLQLKCPLIDTSDLSNWNHAKTRFPSGRMLWICDVLRLSYSKFWRKKTEFQRLTPCLPRNVPLLQICGACGVIRFLMNEISRPVGVEPLNVLSLRMPWGKYLHLASPSMVSWQY